MTGVNNLPRRQLSDIALAFRLWVCGRQSGSDHIVEKPGLHNKLPVKRSYYPYGTITSFDPPRGKQTTATCINDSGVIAGSYYYDWNNQIAEGFLRVPQP
jgi:hypothetical protein